MEERAVLEPPHPELVDLASVWKTRELADDRPLDDAGSRDGHEDDGRVLGPAPPHAESPPRRLVRHPDCLAHASPRRSHSEARFASAATLCRRCAGSSSPAAPASSARRSCDCSSSAVTTSASTTTSRPGAPSSSPAPARSSSGRRPRRRVLVAGSGRARRRLPPRRRHRGAPIDRGPASPTSTSTPAGRSRRSGPPARPVPVASSSRRRTPRWAPAPTPRARTSRRRRSRPYGASKATGEAYCSAFHGAYGLEAVAVRFSNAYGPRSAHKSNVIPLFIRRLLEGRELVVYGDGAQTRDFVFVTDLAQGLVRASEADGAGGEVFQLASGVETSVNDLLTLLARSRGPSRWCGASRPGPGEILRNYSLIDKARDRLGYSPRFELGTASARPTSGSRAPRRRSPANVARPAGARWRNRGRSGSAAASSTRPRCRLDTVTGTSHRRSLRFDASRMNSELWNWSWWNSSPRSASVRTAR